MLKGHCKNILLNPILLCLSHAFEGSTNVYKINVNLKVKFLTNNLKM